MYTGVDLSHWNKILNYDTLARNIQFAILKAGGSDNKQYYDKTFETMYRELTKRGVPVGAYYYIGRNTITAARGLDNAKHFVSIISGKRFEYPVVIDVESNSPKHKAGATEAVIAFCNHLEAYGYYAMIYGSDLSTFRDKVDLSRLNAYDKWVARYGTEPKYVKSYGIWQNSSKGKVAGIAGNVDTDISYKNYPKIMAKAHLNGF